jgi:hypothetical protein
MTLPRDPEAVRVLAEKLARDVAVGGKVVRCSHAMRPSELIEAAGITDAGRGTEMSGAW